MQTLLKVVAGTLTVTTLVNAPALAGEWYGTKVNAFATSNPVSIPEPGCQGSTVDGNSQLRNGMTAAGVALTSSGVPLIQLAGGVLTIGSTLVHSKTMQDFANCAVSCAIIPTGVSIVKVNLYFMGTGPHEQGGVPVGEVPDGGKWNAGDGYWGAIKTPRVSLDATHDVQCVEFRNWAHGYDRTGIYDIVVTAP